MKKRNFLLPTFLLFDAEPSLVGVVVADVVVVVGAGGSAGAFVCACAALFVAGGTTIEGAGRAGIVFVVIANGWFGCMFDDSVSEMHVVFPTESLCD